MAVKIEKKLIANYGKGKNYTPGRSAKVKHVIEHYTGTLASAWNNLKYFASKYVGASAHYFIDPDGKVYLSVEEKDTAWSVGASKYKHKTARNSNSISIEYVANNRKFTDAQIKAGAELTADIIKRHGLTESAILRHYDVTGKLCPAWYIDAGRWKALLKQLVAAVQKALKPAPKPTPAPAKKPTTTTKPKQIELASVLKKGSKGEKVKLLQKALGVSADGDFGSKTHDAVVKFQRAKKLTADGKVGKSTAAKLGWKWTGK